VKYDEIKKPQNKTEDLSSKKAQTQIENIKKDVKEPKKV
jgi:hypothetical protein